MHTSIQSKKKLHTFYFFHVSIVQRNHADFTRLQRLLRQAKLPKSPYWLGAILAHMKFTGTQYNKERKEEQINFYRDCVRTNDSEDDLYLPDADLGPQLKTKANACKQIIIDGLTERSD